MPRTGNFANLAIAIDRGRDSSNPNYLEVRSTDLVKIEIR